MNLGTHASFEMLWDNLGHCDIVHQFTTQVTHLSCPKDGLPIKGRPFKEGSVIVVPWLPVVMSQRLKFQKLGFQGNRSWVEWPRANMQKLTLCNQFGDRCETTESGGNDRNSFDYLMKIQKFISASTRQ